LVEQRFVNPRRLRGKGLNYRHMVLSGAELGAWCSAPSKPL
jgi:hypothetical protein